MLDKPCTSILDRRNISSDSLCHGALLTYRHNLTEATREMVKKSTDDVKNLASFPAGGPHVSLPTMTITKGLTIGIEKTDPNETIERIHQCHHRFPEGSKGFSGETEEYG
jgi:hypothetical protein